jgi:hypothetical protein
MNTSLPLFVFDDNIVVTILTFVGCGYYRYIAVNRQFRRCYLEAFPGKKLVYAKNAVASVSCARIASVEATQWFNEDGYPVGFFESGDWEASIRDPKVTICPIAARYVASIIKSNVGTLQNRHCGNRLFTCL